MRNDTITSQKEMGPFSESKIHSQAESPEISMQESVTDSRFEPLYGTISKNCSNLCHPFGVIEPGC